MIRLVYHGSWIADLAIENTRIHGYTRAAETSTLGALASFDPDLLPFTANFRKARAIYPSVIYPLRRPSSPSDSRTRDLGPTACTLRARSSLDQPRTRSEPRRAVSFYHREGDGSTSLCKCKIDVDPHILRTRARTRERETEREVRDRERSRGSRSSAEFETGRRCRSQREHESPSARSSPIRSLPSSRAGEHAASRHRHRDPRPSPWTSPRSSRVLMPRDSPSPGSGLKSSFSSDFVIISGHEIALQYVNKVAGLIVPLARKEETRLLL